MKKVLSVMIAAAMVSFVACKGKTEEAAPATDSPAVEAPAAEMTSTPAEDSAKMMVADSTKPAEGAKEGEKHEEGKH